ncbi:MAG: DEAD/DEAH box helicase [Myxococcales bacterium]|nr:DEAD/DEAH box helicase [Myxococcales bacterium]
MVACSARVAYPRARMPEDGSLLGIASDLQESMTRRGFSALTAVQRSVVENKEEDRDLRISSQTGSGKTVAVGLALERHLHSNEQTGRTGPYALVLAPTRELAAQVRGELGSLFEARPGIDVVVITGGTDPVRERRALAKHPMLVVATPGRLLDHVRSGAIELSGVRHVVLDEADQMLDLGFREELDSILEGLHPERRVHMVSATFARGVLRFADRYQHNALHIEGTRLGDANADIEHVAHLVLPHERHGALINLLLSDHVRGGGSWLVFVRRRMDTAELAELLAEDGFSAMPFSGELSQAQRERTLAAFRRGLIRVLVATDVAARGIDVQDISTVVHYDLPTDPESFTHRSGRTGRAGQKGRSLLLVPPSAERPVRRLLGRARIDAEWTGIPDAKRIEKSALKATRRVLHARLDAGEEVAAKQLTYAESLLEKHDPATLVAVLLEMARTEMPREAVTVRPLEPRGESAPEPRARPRFRGRPRWARQGPPGRSGGGGPVGRRRPRSGGGRVRSGPG